MDLPGFTSLITLKLVTSKAEIKSFMEIQNKPI